MQHLPLPYAAFCLLLVVITSGVSSTCEPDALLERHNYFRAKHGVPPLTWNNTIEAVARSYANHLAATGEIVHSGNTNYGENLAANGAGFDMSLMIDKMYSEEIQRYDSWCGEPADNSRTGHFTQIVWKSTAQLGCACAFYHDQSKGQVQVCNFYPPGNVPNQFAENVLPAIGDANCPTQKKV